MVLVLGVLAYQVTRTTLALREASQSVEQLRASVGAGELDRARAEIDGLADSAETAHEHSDGVLWRATTVLPVLGDDARAVADLADALDQVARVGPGAVDALAAAASGRLRTETGGVDLDTVRELQQPVAEVSAGAASARSTVADLDPATLLGPLRGRAEEFLEQLDTLAVVMGGAETATQLLPAMLGGEGRRDYLLVVQNNAEIRATGGLPGSASVLSARDGRLRLGFQGSAGDLQAGAAGVGSFEPGERETFGSVLRTDFRDASLTPDFPRAAARMALYADAALGREVDGVITVDPVTLAQVLAATGPVEVAGQRLDADNALRALLFEPYQRLDTEQQDAYFALAARGILDALLGNQGDQLALVETLSEAVAQRRLLVWSRDEGEQDRIAEMAVASALPTDTGRPEVGFYLNDGTAAKIQYFLRYDADLVSLGCDPDGHQLVRASMELSSGVPRPVSRLATSVTGGGTFAARGENRMILRVFAPQGGELRALEVDGERVEIVQTRVYDREVSTLPITLEPGQRSTVTAVLASVPGDTADPRLQWTPGMTWAPTQATAASRCLG